MLQTEKSIGEIEGILNMPRKTVSNHIKKYESEEAFIPTAEKHKATCSKKNQQFTEIEQTLFNESKQKV